MALSTKLVTTTQSASDNSTALATTAYADAAGGGGGASPAWVTNDPDTPPSSPTTFGGTVYDIEFVRDGSLASGTNIGSPATVPSIVDNALRVVGGTNVSIDLKGIEWVCPPSASFTMTTKLRRYFKQNSNYGVLTPFLRVGTSGAGNLTGLASYQNGTMSACNLEIQRYTTPTNRASIGSTFPWAVLSPYYYARTVYVLATGFTYQVSPSGHPDTFETIATDTQASGLGAAPGRFGLVIDSFSGAAWKGYCEWIRFT